MKFTDSQYEDWMKNTDDKENRLILLKKYNEKNNRNFKTPIEAIHKLSEENYSTLYISKIFDISKQCVLYNLKRIGAKIKPRGGKNNKKLSPLSVWMIKNSDLNYRILGDLLNVSKTCIYHAKRNKIWVNDPDVEFYFNLSEKCNKTDLAKIIKQTIRDN